MSPVISELENRSVGGLHVLEVAEALGQTDGLIGKQEPDPVTYEKAIDSSSFFENRFQRLLTTK